MPVQLGLVRGSYSGVEGGAIDLSMLHSFQTRPGYGSIQLCPAQTVESPGNEADIAQLHGCVTGSPGIKFKALARPQLAMEFDFRTGGRLDGECLKDGFRFEMDPRGKCFDSYLTVLLAAPSSAGASCGA